MRLQYFKTTNKYNIDKETTLTRHRQVYPRAVWIDVVRFLDEYDGTLVPAFVVHPQIVYLDGRVLQETYPTLEVGVDVRWEAIQLDVDRYLDVLLVPLDHVLDVLAARVADVALEYDAAADRRRFPHGAALQGVGLRDRRLAVPLTSGTWKGKRLQ